MVSSAFQSPTGSAKKWKLPLGIAVFVALPLIWLVYPLFGLLILIPIAAIGAIAIKRKRWWVAVLLLLINPIAFAAIAAVSNYARGDIYLTGGGLPGLESWNLRRHPRIYRFSGGCPVGAGRSTSIATHNIMMRLLVSKLGPAENTYLGPYPTHDEVLHILDDQKNLVESTEILISDLKLDRLVFPDATISLPQNHGKGILDTYGREYSDFFSPSRKVQGFLLCAHGVSGEYVVLQIPSMYPNVPIEDASGVLLLLDAKTGITFACYGYGPTPPSNPPWFLRSTSTP